MTEELVTLKTAKILKEKGFNEFCKDIINDNGKLMETVYRTNNDLPKSFYSCPTQSIAQKWLREIRGVYVYVEPVIGKRWKLSFCDFNVPTEESDWMENEINKGNGYKVYVTYEEALEAGIQEALMLI
ncbi:MAG: hypothetical protein E7G44_04970 [Phocaeicola vulgatus]|jgi:hypothetical protein|uniref:Uncharacterized protein n=1 Tax=Phocaeicola vulgatus TaxID=821 RepID=A0A1Q6IZR4_PHOVU|nr:MULTISPECIES: hypothetical protein [Phocaeicola]MDU3760809.1 hypothetical protein [Bacteroides sp.]UVM89812.1 MAG: hypothetical protein [Bacteriophage sp.]MBU8982118.1 hypothetical protein [Phocaeicola vulgatus]MBU9015567.1 hypothetical protein [Phocaeicola vulgatus]MBU9033229.1 hypothetical protein [Phocaeicola vulgatus]